MDRHRFQFNIGTTMLAILVMGAVCGLALHRQGGWWRAACFSVVVVNGPLFLMRSHIIGRLRADGRRPTPDDWQGARMAQFVYFAILATLFVALATFRMTWH